MHLRPLRREDLELEEAFIARLSPQTLYLRTQYYVQMPSKRDLERLLDLDYHDRLAVAALVDTPAGPAIVGVSRYARLEGTRRAECAIVVADDWQGRGLGTELMQVLAEAARARGIECLEGTTLAENQRITAWAQRFGFSARTEPNSGGLLKITLDLQAGG